MSRLNTAIKKPPVYTHGGAVAFGHLKPIEQLRRSVLSCLLWEREFYEDGQSIADRITEFADKVKPEELAGLAVEARKVFHLRHVPLLLLCSLIKRTDCSPGLVSEAIFDVVSRVDELTELLAIYWRNGRCPVDRQLRLGLARAITKFDEYQLAKYDRDGAIKLRDVFRIARPKPKNAEQEALWRRVVKRELKTPDTWEVALSGGANKKETFERLIQEGNLGYLALLRNLRNMAGAGVDSSLVRQAILARKNGADRVLPWRYVAAARACPQFEPQLDAALQAGLEQMPKLPGKTVIVVDISGSMGAPLSVKSDLNRLDTACALGAIGRGICEDVRIFATAGDDWKRKHATGESPPRSGMALIDAIKMQERQLGHGGIFLKQVMAYLRKEVGEVDRVIVVTDEQDCGISSDDRPTDAVPIAPKAYMLNVGSAKNGIGYGPKWTNITGFSENVFRYISEVERGQN